MKFFLLFITFVGAGTAQTAPGAAPIQQLPYAPSLDRTSMDTTVNPCEDFYRYACGDWIRKNPIPPDQPAWGVYAKLTYDNERLLWGLLEDSARPSSERSPQQQKIGDYFHACMDQGAIEKAGLAPIEATLKQIAALKDIDGLLRYVTERHRVGPDSSLVFRFSSNQDLENAQNVIAFADRGKLGLPDRDYYTKTDPKSIEIRAKYVEHMRQVFSLLGESADAAGADAQRVIAIETALASSMLTRVELRNPRNLLHKQTVAQLQVATPRLPWMPFLKAQGLDNIAVVNVTEPAFFAALNKELATRTVDDWKAFLRWNLIRDSSDYLPLSFAQPHFDFYGKYLRGIPEMRPRWRLCTQWVDRDLGEALGQVFVTRTFAPDTKARTLKMTREIEAAMEQEVKALPWMGEQTRKQAVEKLHAIANKIGYPDRWRDYGSVDIRRDDFFGNVERAQRFEYRRELAKIGKPLDRGEWGMTPPTVNAYYNPQMNDINFPAGILQPPLFDPKMDDAPNYGNTGSTIGHELTHGFDDEGRQFDAAGNLRDWWTPEDAAQFEKRAACVSDQYAQYTVVDDIKINSKLTLGEDVADLGGTLLAYMAWKAETTRRDLKPIDDFTPDQRFFIGFAQWACGDMRPEMKREMALTDPHSPEEYRINGVVANIPEFAHAFSCTAGQKMVRDKVCKIW